MLFMLIALLGLLACPECLADCLFIGCLLCYGSFVCMCLRLCARVCVCVRVCAFVCACACAAIAGGARVLSVGGCVVGVHSEKQNQHTIHIAWRLLLHICSSMISISIRKLDGRQIV
jgi:hypothetical protein